MIRGVDHLGIAVDDLDASLARFRELFGLESAGTETVREHGVQVAFVPLEGTRLELLAPTGPETPVGRFLERRGAGLHHVCFQVDDLGAALARLTALGVRLIDREPRPGAGGAQVAFVHPSETAGVLVELRQGVLARMTRRAPTSGAAEPPVGKGEQVIAFLQSPKERIWGILRGVDTAGAWVEGLSLDSFEDWAREVARGEGPSMSLSVAFYPLRRVEKILLDRSAPDQPSLGDRFRELVGIGVDEYLGLRGPAGDGAFEKDAGGGE